MSRDPIGYLAGDANLYGYVNGNSLSNLDPAGLRTIRYKFEKAPGKYSSFGYEFTYKYKTSCGADGKSPSFSPDPGLTEKNSLWQLDNFSAGVVGGSFDIKVKEEVKTGKKCPPRTEGGVLEIKLKFTPVNKLGLSLGLGPFSLPVNDGYEFPSGDPSYEVTILVQCCKPCK